jgi:mannose-6-phosphate isomerase-like protein (cupin superfamily)
MPLKPFAVRVKGKKKFQRLVESTRTKGIKSGVVSLNPGESVGEHITESKEEILFILKGKAKIFCGNKSALKVEDNSIAYIPPEIKHNVCNIGDDLLQYLYVVSPI